MRGLWSAKNLAVLKTALGARRARSEMAAPSPSSSHNLIFRRTANLPPDYLLSPPGRRLGVLEGKLETTGYFATQVCLPHAMSATLLIVDTGSAITSVPCRHCSACGTHKCGRRGRPMSARPRRPSVQPAAAACLVAARHTACDASAASVGGRARTRLATLKGAVSAATSSATRSPSQLHCRRGACARASILAARRARRANSESRRPTASSACSRTSAAVKAAGRARACRASFTSL